MANWVVVEVKTEDGGGGGGGGDGGCGGDGIGEEQRMGEWSGDALIADGKCEIFLFWLYLFYFFRI